MKIWKSSSNNFLRNQAFEEYLFHRGVKNTLGTDNREQLYLWRNDPVVVIGRHQNAYKECKLSDMEKDGVYLARRESGGGAVYQDLGNTNYTFLSPKQTYNKDRNTDIVLAALADLGFAAKAHGRNDVVLDFHKPFTPKQVSRMSKQVFSSPDTREDIRKISGAAFRISGEQAIHHGTMLLDVDLDALQRYLNPDKKKLQSKGVDSVRARVTNLGAVSRHYGLVGADIGPDFEAAVADNFRRAYDLDSEQCPLVLVDDAAMDAMPGFAEFSARFGSWDWRFGRSPDLDDVVEHRFDWGGIEVHYSAEAGHIRQCQVFSDALNPALAELVQKSLTGVQLDSNSILQRSQSDSETDLQLDQVLKWFISTL